MTANILLMNTHPGSNPDFISPLQQFIHRQGMNTDVVSGYDALDPSLFEQEKIILSGVPLEANYSLSEKDTQTLITHHFSWIRDWHSPLLGICYGHQILAHLFKGSVQPLARTVYNQRYPLELDPTRSERSIFAGLESIEVFAEHRDYVATVPEGFDVLSSRNGVPYIIHSPQRRFYGVQFVPEQSGHKTRQALIRFLQLES